MSLPGWLFPNLRKRQANPQKPIEEKRLCAFNATRQSVLASQLEVADTAATRNKGLLGRTGLAEGGGLWIAPCESVHTFFMQFPIDLVYLDRRHRVRKVRSSVPAWRLSACLSAHSILELPAGTIRESRTSRGDLVEFLPANEAGVETQPAASASEANSDPTPELRETDSRQADSSQTDLRQTDLPEAEPHEVQP